MSEGLPAGETERYGVAIQQVLLSGPVPFTSRWDFASQLVVETMSGASPWYTVPDAAGRPIQVMSGATIEEQRSGLNLETSFYRDEETRLGFGAGFSSENDYRALSFSTEAERQLNEKNTTLGAGIGISLDSIEPTDAGLFPTRPASESKRSVTLFGSVAQLLDRRATVQSSLTYRFQSGYLDDPYKQVFVLGGGFLPDRRPSSRHQLTWLTRYRRHIEEVNGSVHVDYQFQIDSWNITAHTLELALHKSFGDALTLIPSIRWYSQSEADFYTPYFLSDPGPGEYSSDYRLSAFGALSLGIGVEYRFRTPWTGDLEWHAKFSWERYASSEDLSHADAGRDSPGLVNWSLLSLGLSVRF